VAGADTSVASVGFLLQKSVNRSGVRSTGQPWKKQWQTGRIAGCGGRAGIPGQEGPSIGRLAAGHPCRSEAQR